MIQLRLRTEYSFGNTFAPIDRVVERLKAIGCTAAGIVDGGTWGHVPWFHALREAGIQPLLGVEIAVDTSERLSKMWFLARSEAGLSEMYRFSSLAHRQSAPTKTGSVPRLYDSDVLEMSEDIVKFAGEMLDEGLLVESGAWVDLNPGSTVLNLKKQQIVRRNPALRLVATSDNAYCFPEDRKIFELISKAGTKPSAQYILDALEYGENAAEIVAGIRMEALPKAPMIRAEGDLEALCREGIAYRKLKWNERYEERLKYELDLIRSKDYEAYFLVVADMVRYAKRFMLVGPSRGSAAGSLVCYLARITEIDPMPPRLYFERFIEVSRKDLPDIDLDFPDAKRAMVFEYMAEKYGAKNTAHIGTISRFKPKSALIQVCKALGIPPTATGALKVAMIERSSGDARANNCLEDTLKDTAPGRAFAAAYPEAAVSSLIEGHASHTGVHAAGLIVCNDEITNYATVDANGIAHIDKGAAETLGLLKIDVLGLRTLGILEDAGVPIEWYDLPFDDPETLAIFNNNRLSGIFQFEGNAMRSIAPFVKFRSITEIDAVTALARPGPFAGGVTQKYIARMNGEKYAAIHPLVEEHMKETYGLPVYQEQTLAIVREIGKFDWLETSTIRKAMSKRLGKEFFDTYWAKFWAGAESQGIGEPEARATWEMINAMGSWQMNKAHTYSYAVISYWTAYLKAHYPLEFAAASLRNAKNEESAIELLREMVREGIEYVAFDIERSKMNWSVQDGKLYGGFMCLNGIGESKALKLIEARDAGTLTDKQRATMLEAKNVFEDLFPMETRYGDWYANPHAHGIAADKLSKIEELTEGMPHRTERVFIGELIHKNPRNANEDAEIKKRGGKIETGQLEYLDLRLRDDTGMIGARVGRYDYLRIGVELVEHVPIGSHLLVRAAFYNGIRYAFIKKWRRLDEG